MTNAGRKDDRAAAPTRRRRPSAATQKEPTVATPEEPITNEVAESSRRPAWAVPALRPLSPIPTYIGVVVTALGFLLLLFTWGQVAGEASVALQIPYLVSGGLTGLGLILVGVGVMSIATKRRDTALREQQTQLLADALRELSRALGPDRQP